MPALPLQCSFQNKQLLSPPRPAPLHRLPGMAHHTLPSHVSYPSLSTHWVPAILASGVPFPLPPQGLCTHRFFHLDSFPHPFTSYETPSDPDLLGDIVYDPPTTTKSRSPVICFHNTLCFLLLNIITACNYIFEWLFDKYLLPSLSLKAS